MRGKGKGSKKAKGAKASKTTENTTVGAKYSVWHKGSDDGSTPSSSDSEHETGRNTRKQAIMTDFYIDLKELQRKYYMHLRASIVLYMDEPAKNFYDAILAQEDAKKKLPMSEKYLPDKRITWQWIKNMIYTKMCRRTNDSYFYRPLMTRTNKHATRGAISS